ncbi:MAG: rod shape-determining protein MreC [Chlorobiales bacterium]|nr:rod shape-determining protein MreC [Chlorobiales bacterium]
MNRITSVLYDFREYLLLILYSLISLGLFASQDSAALRIMRSASLELFSTLEGGLTFFSRYVSVMGENDRLREQNMTLSAQTNLIRNAQAENERLRSLLNFQQKTGASLKIARVVDRTFGTLRNLLTINIGSSDGIKPDMAVLTDRGLVGRVVLVSPHYALVQPIINPDFRVSVVSEKTRALGVISWQGPDEGVATLLHVPVSTKLENGDYLYTTDFSTFASPNVFVGQIETIEEDNYFYRVKVKLGVDFTTLTEVFVDLRTVEREKMELHEQYKQFQ